MSTHQPRRGDAVEAWIKAARDTYPQNDETSVGWCVLDDLLDDYRLSSDLGVTFDSEHPVGTVAKCCGTTGCDSPTCPHDQATPDTAKYPSGGDLDA